MAGMHRSALLRGNTRYNRFVTFVIFWLPFDAVMVDVAEIKTVSNFPPCPDRQSTSPRCFRPALLETPAALRATNATIMTKASMDRLQVLILGQDLNLVRIVRVALEDLGIAGSHCRTESAQAIEALDHSHFDGIILDCDDLTCAQKVLTKIRTGPSNRQSPVLVLLNGPADLRAMQNCGANFNVCKPISTRTIQEQLTKALDAMQKEYRRYFRYTVSLQIFVGTEKDSLTAAKLMNVSAEGLAVWSGRSVKPEGKVNLRFDLPSIDPYRIEANGEVVWADAAGRMGIKLSLMPAEARRKYTEWLDVLHSQHEFRKLTEETSPNELHIQASKSDSLVS